ncbi:uncharacterized protein tmem79a isoform X1 [Hypomesus transpacificus]|uniref:uncharacterized protein tmem79a isoform X1 n=1 Tax=Hypomesus transpacificus TaxID=137520 RepID=UPI001F075560|nr:uncharacterized protein tmem79a isoform X1 [Hypomesus transpacificus]
MSEQQIGNPERGSNERPSNYEANAEPQIPRNSQDGSELQSTAEEKEEKCQSENKARFKWRESMPEGERWMKDGVEKMGEHSDGSHGSVPDNQDMNRDYPEDWTSEKEAPFFSPQVNIVCPSWKQELPQENEEELPEKRPLMEPHTTTISPVQYYSELTEEDDDFTYICDSDKLKLSVGVAVAALLFPLLVWGGYAFLPFDAPLLDSAPLRLVYTLRCSFFAIVPIMLGVMVQGVARLRYGALTPLYDGRVESREVLVHWHFVSDSLALFLFYFLLLAVMATYISQDFLKIVPLLTIVFTFGRLIYWVCVSLGSSVRGLGFGLSFFPVLVMLGANLYFVCSSLREGAIFDVAPPTTAPPPRQRWFG